MNGGDATEPLRPGVALVRICNIEPGANPLSRQEGVDAILPYLIPSASLNEGAGFNSWEMVSCAAATQSPRKVIGN